VESTSAHAQGSEGAESTVRAVEVLGNLVRIHGVDVERPGVVAYLESIAPEKQEIALIHALEVGVTELVARRARFRQP
jgi:hypothetical protein